MRERPALFLGLLADQPELVAEVGALQWRAAGSIGTPGPWIQAVAATSGRDSLPLTLVAMGLDGEVIAAATLDLACDEAGAGGCATRSPWLVRMVVRPGERLCGVGRLVMNAAEQLAREHGHDRLWVTAGEDAEFYRHCGWVDDGHEHDTAPVLSKSLTPA